jgi:hypothetical protein
MWHGLTPRRLLALRAVSLVALIAGAAGSVGFMLHVGHRNNSLVLLMLFGIWVLSPFIALVLANAFWKPGSVLTRATSYSVMLVVAMGSLAINGYFALRPRTAKPAGIFLVVPLASWLFIAADVARRNVGFSIEKCRVVCRVFEATRHTITF